MERSFTSSRTALNAPAKHAQMTRISSSDEAASLTATVCPACPVGVGRADACLVARADACAVADADGVADAWAAGCAATACGDGWDEAWWVALPPGCLVCWTVGCTFGGGAGPRPYLAGMARMTRPSTI